MRKGIFSCLVFDVWVNVDVVVAFALSISLPLSYSFSLSLPLSLPLVLYLRLSRCLVVVPFFLFLLSRLVVSFLVLYLVLSGLAFTPFVSSGCLVFVSCLSRLVLFCPVLLLSCLVLWLVVALFCLAWHILPCLVSCCLVLWLSWLVLSCLVLSDLR
jgi:hypothetical protein